MGSCRGGVGLGRRGRKVRRQGRGGGGMHQRGLRLIPRLRRRLGFEILALGRWVCWDSGGGGGAVDGNGAFLRLRNFRVSGI